MSTSIRAALPRAAAVIDERQQRHIATWNHERLAPGFPPVDWEMRLARDARMLAAEAAFVETLRSAVMDDAADAPNDANGFIAWFQALEVEGPGQGDPLFPWLAEEAELEDMRWFLRQEAAGEAGFDDLVAYTQVRLPPLAKLELARNYWDEMGRGNIKGMHGPMLDVLADRLDLNPQIETTVPESLALANAMTAMATCRRYAWHSIGALGVVELTAPARAASVSKGLRRLGFTGKERRYFDLHAILDVKHSITWNREALRPLVEEDPRRATAIAEGALIRLHRGAACFARYRDELWS